MYKKEKETQCPNIYTERHQALEMTTTTEMKFFSYSLQQIDGSCNLRITKISGVLWSSYGVEDLFKP